MDFKELCQKAIAAKESAYAPYSHFRVGAALLAENGSIYSGCNIENAAFTPSCCAERTAFVKAVSEGQHSFSAIAVSGDAEDYLFPCGVCRQVMVEFCDPEKFQVILVKPDGTYKSYLLKELMPGAFTPDEYRKGVRNEKKIDKKIT